ncbi:Nucleolar Complex 2 protein [Salvia divinorum]|uniref:Nucleolar Complex 2 protein n=1 Tax=Salvia divinorum TaxID=28513 RepID=A0ABD1IBM9_SALDI
MEKEEAKEHIGTLKKLQEKDPEFYEFLKEHDKELLDFDEEDLDDNLQTDAEDEDEDEEVDDDVAEYSDLETATEEDPSTNVITSAMVDSWIEAIRSESKLAAVHSILKAFRSACHYGDDSGDDPAVKFSTMSSSVFNKIMLFVLNEMDGILRGILKFPSSGGKEEMVKELMATKRWKKYNLLVKSYLGNALHTLNQMTDNEMIAFMLRRLRYSSVFLAAFPALLRKYTKVALHFWGTGSGALPVVSFLFLRDCCIRLGADCLEDCIKGMYKAYVLNCHFVNSTKLQHIQFLGNCFAELLRVDIPAAYQHAFVYIRQLVMILKEALFSPTKKKKNNSKGKDEPSKKEKGKEAPSSSSNKDIFRKVYQWKFINCLELWTGVVCAYSNEADLKPLAYPLTQIITGVARLVPSACYFPLRLRCVRMLNRISASTGSFIPVSLLLLDSLEFKELRKPPTGGVGKAVDFFSILKVSKSTLKTRSFQEACVFSVVEELTEHLAQWSYSIAFLELSFIPGVRLRNFTKSTKVDRFRKEIRRLTRQIDANSDFVNKKRTTVALLPNDTAAESFLEDVKNSGTSPLSQYAATLRQRAQERSGALTESSVLIGDGSSKFGSKTSSDDDEHDDSETEGHAGAMLSDHYSKQQKNVNKKSSTTKHTEEMALDEDIVEDLVLSSDEDVPLSDSDEDGDDEPEEDQQERSSSKKRKHGVDTHKGKQNGGNRKSKKKKKTHGR